MKENLVANITAKYGAKVAFIESDAEYTYMELEGEIRFFSQFLQTQGVRPGDVIAILSEYSFKSVALFLALLDGRNIIVPVVSNVESEIQERLRESYIDRVVRIESKDIKITRPEGDVSKKHELIKRLQDQGLPGLVLFSSGSTGRPKAMIHNLANMVETYRDRPPKKHRILLFLMFDHVGGLNTLFSALSAGMTIVIPSRREPDHICDLIARHRVNILPTSPTFLNLILMSGAHEKCDISSLRLVTYGTEPMAESLLNRLKQAFPRVRFLQTFGTSETGIAKTSSKSSASTLLKIDDPNQEYKIVNGELWLRSKTQILGYLNYSEEMFTEDGWFKTGDLVEETEDGYLRIVGRSKEMINVGGQKVLPTEVESVLLEMPQVADCTVFGEFNPITLQAVATNVVLARGANPKTIKKDVRAFCRNRLENYKIPVRVRVVEETSYGDHFKKKRLNLWSGK